MSSTQLMLARGYAEAILSRLHHPYVDIFHQSSCLCEKENNTQQTQTFFCTQMFAAVVLSMFQYKLVPYHYRTPNAKVQVRCAGVQLLERTRHNIPSRTKGFVCIHDLCELAAEILVQQETFHASDVERRHRSARPDLLQT